MFQMTSRAFFKKKIFQRCLSQRYSHKVSCMLNELFGYNRRFGKVSIRRTSELVKVCVWLAATD